MDHFKYKDFVSAMEDLAVRHNEILHNNDLGGGVTRKAFYRANNEEEIRQDLGGKKVYYPYMILAKPYFKYGEAGEVNKHGTFGFEIRMKVSSPDDDAAIDETREDCQRIAEEVLAFINLLAEQGLSSSPFYAFDVSTVQGDFTGPVHESEYGYLVRWGNKEGAWNPFHYDPNDFFDTVGMEDTGFEPEIPPSNDPGNGNGDAWDGIEW